MKIILSILSTFILALGVSACGYDGNYRYPCQDPANWQNAECNPPICDAEGSCTKDLLGFDPNETNQKISEITEEPVESPTSAIIDEPVKNSTQENVDEINGMINEISKGNE